MTAPCQPASRVSPRLARRGASLPDLLAGSREARAGRYWLRDLARRVLPLGHRTVHCGLQPIGANVAVTLGGGVATLRGFETCGSPWACAVCAGKVAAGRRDEVERALDQHMADGGQVYMAAFTMPHYAAQSARELRETISAAWKGVLGGAPWNRAKGLYQVVGVIRALEVTHGANGWHPHLHVLFLLKGSVGHWQAQEFGTWLFRRWSRMIARRGYGECTAAVWRFEQCHKTTAAGAYVAKWGADSEMAGGSGKKGRGGSRSPWELLEASAEGDARAGRLFREYALAFKGARQLTWSRGLKERFGLVDHDDETLAEREAPAPVIAHLSGRAGWKLSRAGLVAEFLSTLERWGWHEARRFLTRWGLGTEGVDWFRCVDPRGGGGSGRVHEAEPVERCDGAGNGGGSAG